MRRLALLMVAVGTLAGCKKKTQTATPPVAKTDTAPATAESTPAVPREEILGTVRFAFDRADLTGEAKAVLRDLAPRIEKPALVRIEGHADERGSTEYNLALSEKRAAAVLRFLSDLGVPARRLSTVAYGEEKPADTALTPEAHAKNRRAELRLLPREVVKQP